MTDPNMTWAAPEGADPVAPATPVPVVKPKSKSSGLTNALLLVAVLIAVGGVTFAIGRATAPASAAGGVTSGPGRAGLGPGGSFDPGAGPAGADRGGSGNRAVAISGTVKSVDGSTLVLTTADGTETTVDVSGSTYHAQSPATSADVTAGTEVSVSVTGLGGMRRSDGGGAPGAGGAPNGGAAPDGASAPGSGTVTATDVTITSN